MSVHYSDDMVTLHHGDALTVAKGLESGSAQTIVTSPPYYGLRDYGAVGQLGAEASVQEYVDNMTALFRELRRVLADDGTLWLNLGDSYGAGKQLLGVPWAVAFGLRHDGWILRSDIIWAKKNVMPESVSDRPTKAHEHVFLFAKSPRYLYNAEAIREEASPASEARYASGYKTYGKNQREGSQDDSRKAREYAAAGLSGRNKRDVWHVATVPFPGAHFAVYPPDLIRPCILAGSRPGDTILDPFSGSGTTGMVAGYEGRKYVGIDLNADYLDLSLRTRFSEPTLGIEVAS